MIRLYILPLFLEILNISNLTVVDTPQVQEPTCPIATTTTDPVTIAIEDPNRFAFANVSQTEYERAHREYLKNVQLSHDEQKSGKRLNLHVFSATEYPGNKSAHTIDNNCERNDCHYLYFPVKVSDNDVTVDYASLRFFFKGITNVPFFLNDRKCSFDLEVLVYQRTAIFQQPLLRKKIPMKNPRDSRWLELDVTEAASSWLKNKSENLGLELVFLQDGQPTLREISQTTLNVFTTSESNVRTRRSTPDQLMSLHKSRRIKCNGDNKRCCRHELNVMFKDLEGFEFVVYPKGFDTGYCKGRCPPRYNPAHHHALLQSLLWKEDKKVPKPCCAPSKLDQLMIVYYDENDSTQLKVSYWNNIQVLECACS